MNTQRNICHATLSSGNRRGQECGRQIYHFQLYCGFHSRRRCRVCEERYEAGRNTQEDICPTCERNEIQERQQEWNDTQQDIEQNVEEQAEPQPEPEPEQDYIPLSPIHEPQTPLNNRQIQNSLRVRLDDRFGRLSLETDFQFPPDVPDPLEGFEVEYIYPPPTPHVQFQQLEQQFEDFQQRFQQFEEQFEVNPIVQPKPITNLNDVRNMVKWIDGLSTNTKDICSVCLDDDDDNTVETQSKEKVLTNCKHTFHKDCIWEWSFTNRKDTCPCCRSNIFS